MFTFCLINAARLNLKDTIAELLKNDTRDACKTGETCCDISDIVRSKDENHCPAGQKCTASSFCTEERIGLLDLLIKNKMNYTAVVTEKPSVCPNNEVCCDIEIANMPLKCGFRNINGIGLGRKQSVGDAEFGKFNAIKFNSNIN